MIHFGKEYILPGSVAVASESVDAIDADAVVLAGWGIAVVDVDLTLWAVESGGADAQVVTRLRVARPVVDASVHFAFPQVDGIFTHFTWSGVK